MEVGGLLCAGVMLGGWKNWRWKRGKSLRVLAKWSQSLGNGALKKGHLPSTLKLRQRQAAVPAPGPLSCSPPVPHSAQYELIFAPCHTVNFLRKSPR